MAKKHKAVKLKNKRTEQSWATNRQMGMQCLTLLRILGKLDFCIHDDIY